MSKKEKIVISLGGSLICPDGVDVKFLKSFKSFINKYIDQGYSFIIITGGGVVAREYQRSAASISYLSRDDLDWLGIHTTRLNGHLIRTIFRKRAYPKVVKDPTLPIDKIKQPIIVASGWLPGKSTDYCAVLLAQNYGASVVLNLTNVPYVYDKDPKRFKSAKAIKEINWKDFRKLIPKKWDPGLSSPFDPVAARLAEKLGLQVIIAKGENIDNIENYLNNKDFVGTKIY